jgi:hypothetical protein
MRESMIETTGIGVGHHNHSLFPFEVFEAPTATFIVDRLEKAGLSQRSGSPDDRRVKLVMLTAKLRPAHLYRNELYENLSESRQIARGQ